MIGKVVNAIIIDASELLHYARLNASIQWI